MYPLKKRGNLINPSQRVVRNDNGPLSNNSKNDIKADLNKAHTEIINQNFNKILYKSNHDYRTNDAKLSSDNVMNTNYAQPTNIFNNNINTTDKASNDEKIKSTLSTKSEASEKLNYFNRKNSNITNLNVDNDISLNQENESISFKDRLRQIDLR